MPVPSFIWCKKKECRLPSFRCLLCGEECYSGYSGSDEAEHALQALIRSGNYKERFIMRRKEKAVSPNRPSLVVSETGAEREERVAEAVGNKEDQRTFMLEDGKLKPFSAKDYTASTLYQVVESFEVECRLVRPEDPGNLVFEGKKPSKKTVPILVNKEGDHLLLDSWEDLEARPEQLAQATEVISATPVKQVFVLKRR